MKPKTLQAIEEHALAEYPKESCGLVIAVGRKEVYVPCRNVASTPEEHFTLHPDDWVSAERQGRICTVVHSHPEGTRYPSTADRAACAATGLPWAVVALQTDPSTPGEPPRIVGHELIKPDGYEAPLRGREFVFGVQDCYTLVQDYYKRELGIVLPDFEREDKFWERGENLYTDNFAAAGFDEIAAPTQKGDLILMSIRSDIVNHAGIWLDELDAMLHHPYGHLSERVVFGGYWLENTRLYIRKVR